MIQADVTVEARDEDGIPSYAVKIAAPLVELNVIIPQAEIDRLRDAHATNWAAGAMRLGTAAGAPVYWCAGDHETVVVLIGQDDQTWDIGLTFPAALVSHIFNALPRAADGP